MPSVVVLVYFGHRGSQSSLRNAKVTKVIDAVNFAGNVNITHLIFVDDVLLLGKGSITEWQALLVFQHLS